MAKGDLWSIPPEGRPAWLAKEDRLDVDLTELGPENPRMEEVDGLSMRGGALDRGRIFAEAKPLRDGLRGDLPTVDEDVGCVGLRLSAGGTAGDEGNGMFEAASIDSQPIEC